MLKPQRGDTLVEVLLAVTVFSLLAIGAMTIMNMGTNVAQRALEITQVRQQIDAQAEALRAAQQAFTVAVNPDDPDLAWKQITGESTQVFKDNDTSSGCPEEFSDIPNSFIMNTRDGTKVPGSNWFQSMVANDAPTYAKVMYGDGSAVTGAGIWIERNFDAGDDAPDAYDFNIRTCWFSAGLDVPMRMDTLVRLYEPEV